MTSNKFISILTRTHKRPKALRRCLESLSRQTKKNFNVVIISDHKEDVVENIIPEYPNLSIIVKHVEPLGYPACNTYFNIVRDIVTSEYVIFLDDDDEIIDKDYCKSLEDISIKNKRPAAIISKALFPGKKVIPDDNSWRKAPGMTHISGLNFCVRVDMYKRCNWPESKCGDFYFISNVFKNINWKKEVYWYDKITTSPKSYPGFGREENNNKV
jgi:glycosyltransferase involved in cell wall biosynthesis